MISSFEEQQERRTEEPERSALCRRSTLGLQKAKMGRFLCLEALSLGRSVASARGGQETTVHEELAHTTGPGCESLTASVGAVCCLLKDHVVQIPGQKQADCKQQDTLVEFISWENDTRLRADVELQLLAGSAFARAQKASETLR
ncbi:hypothetical protein SRHO_G00012620 [Serrasalmus rhombeus]